MHVMLATPSYTGYVAFAHAESVTATLMTAGITGVNWYRRGGIGCPVLPRIRNVLVAQMLGEPAFDGILFVDDDIAFNAADAARIVSHGKDVVAGVAQKRKPVHDGPPEINCAFDENATIDRKTGLIRNGLVPTCFLWISRKAFETVIACQELRDTGLIAPFIYHTQTPEAAKWLYTFFSYGLAAPLIGSQEETYAKRLGIENPMVDIGEDYDFALKCQVAGVEMFIDPEIDLVHYDGRVAHDWSLRKMIAAGHMKLIEPEQKDAA